MKKNDIASVRERLVNAEPSQVGDLLKKLTKSAK